LKAWRARSIIGELEEALEESIKATAGTRAPKLKASAKLATIRHNRTIAGFDPGALKKSLNALNIEKCLMGDAGPVTGIALIGGFDVLIVASELIGKG